MIPNSVTDIENHAFYGCSCLTSVTIPNSVTNIGYYAFSNCSGLTTINVEQGNTKYDSRYNCNGVIESESHTLIVGCKNTKIPNNVTSIGYAAFDGCSDLTSITIPYNVKSIGIFAFQGCDITEVISKIEIPFDLDGTAFSDNTYNNGMLYVPVGTIDKYKSRDGWKIFANITEGDPSGVTNVENERATEIKRYTLDGRVVKGSHNGINIIKMNDGKSKKVIIR